MTSAARATSFGGISRPIARAALRLTTRSNRVGKPTCRSLGLAPSGCDRHRWPPGRRGPHLRRRRRGVPLRRRSRASGRSQGAGCCSASRKISRMSENEGGGGTIRRPVLGADGRSPISIVCTGSRRKVQKFSGDVPILGAKEGCRRHIGRNAWRNRNNARLANQRHRSPQKKTPGIAAGGDREHLPTEDQGRKLRWMRKVPAHVPWFAKVYGPGGKPPDAPFCQTVAPRFAVLIAV
jgi:hypothetical protein